ADEPKTKPNVLSPKDAADGWIHLFDGETTFGLETKGGVKIDDGVLVIDGEKGGQVATRVRFPVPIEIVAVAKWTLNAGERLEAGVVKGGLLSIGAVRDVVAKDQWGEIRMTCVPIPNGYETTTSISKPGEQWNGVGRGTFELGRSTIAMKATPGT